MITRVILLLGVVSGIASAYDGALVGSLVTNAHAVEGTVYIADMNTLLLVDFSYDGTGPDAYFLYGTSGTPNGQGMKIPDENGSLEKLGQYTNQRVVLMLPDGVEVQQITWLSVYCIQASVDFGSLAFPDMLPAVPVPKLIGQLSTLAHGVSSGDVWILDKRRFRIENLNYDGAGPDAYFLVGTSGDPIGTGTKVPDENDSTTKLLAYVDATIIITLPEGVDIDDLEWLSIYCILATQNFGDVRLQGPHDNIPPYLPPRMETPLSNCEMMDNTNFNVAWEIMGNNIVFEYEGNIDPSTGYMAFGISGSDSGSVMGGGDVIVVYREGGVSKVKDYTLNAYSLCSEGIGVCPDDDADVGGENNVMMLSASHMDGITKVRFQRPLVATDATHDKAIPATGNAYVIWATGDINAQGMVTKHKQHLSGDKEIDFSRAGTKNCPQVEPVEEEEVDPWDIPMISGEDVKVFTAKIGPTGGKKGYEGITGSISWGIAWYINDLLIPKLVLRRGETFTFKVEGGNDDSNLARYHPLYITDDPVGGYRVKTDAQKEAVTLLAGTVTNDTGTFATDGHYCEYIPNSANPESFESFDLYFASLTLECDDGEPGMFTWTPNSDTPDLVYYQCYTHNNLGWKIQVVDEYSDVNGGSQMFKLGPIVATLVSAIVSVLLGVKLLG